MGGARDKLEVREGDLTKFGMLNSRCVPSPRPGNGGIFPLRALLYLHHTDASACHEMSCCTMFTLFHPTIKYAPCNTIHNMLYHTLPCNTRPLNMMRYESIPNHITQHYTTDHSIAKTISYNTTMKKHNLCPTGAKNGRIVL